MTEPAVLPAACRRGKFRLRFDATPGDYGYTHWEVQIYNVPGIFVQCVFRGFSYEEVDRRATEWVRMHDPLFRIQEQSA